MAIAARVLVAVVVAVLGEVGGGGDCWASWGAVELWGTGPVVGVVVGRASLEGAVSLVVVVGMDVVVDVEVAVGMGMDGLDGTGLRGKVLEGKNWRRTRRRMAGMFEGLRRCWLIVWASNLQSIEAHNMVSYTVLLLLLSVSVVSSK